MIQLNQAPCYCPLYTTISNTIKIIQLNWPPAKNIRLHVIITCYCPFIITPPSLSSISLMVAESPIWINSYNESMYRKNIIRQHDQFWYMQPILLPCCQKEPNWNIQRLKKKKKKRKSKMIRWEMHRKNSTGKKSGMNHIKVQLVRLCLLNQCVND